MFKSTVEVDSRHGCGGLHSGWSNPHVRHVAWLIHLFRFIQGKRRSWHCGAHTLVNSQETCFVSGLAAARQLGADYPFNDPEARRIFNYYGNIMHGRRFRKARR